MFKLLWDTLLATLGKTFKVKIVLLGISFGPLVAWVEKNIFTDWTFAKLLLLLFIMDAFFGSWKHLKFPAKHGPFCFRKFFDKSVTKAVVYVGWLALFGALEKLKIAGADSPIGDWLNHGALTILILREGLSVGENILAVKPDSKMKVLVDRLGKYFDNDKLQKETVQ